MAVTPNGFNNRFLLPSGAFFIGRNPLPGILSIVERAFSNHFQFSFTGDAAAAYTVEISSNLVNWIALTNVTMGTGPFMINDPVSSNSTRRFYRTRPAE